MPFNPPGPPRKLQVENLTKKTCVLTWKEPEFDGGSDIQGYYVERIQGAHSTRWTPINRTGVTTCKLDCRDLIETNQYTFRVYAENAAGPGKPSEPLGPITAKDPFDKPGKPGQPEVTEVVADSATLAWEAPRDDGNSPITNYIVEMKKAGDFTWTTVSRGEKVTRPRYTVRGVKEGVEYEFRVVAENKVGAGPPSDSSKSVKYAEKIEFTRSLEDQKVTSVPTTVTYACALNLSNQPVDWYFGSKKIKRSDKYKIEADGKEHRLIINDVDDRDIGTYSAECKGKETSAQLDVEAPPMIPKLDKYKDGITIMAGKSAVIEVPFSGAPQPDVSWSYNSGRLPDANRTTSETFYNLTSLTISRAKLSDAGKYTLTLENKHGKVTFEIKVKVLDKPGPPRNITARDITETSCTLRWSPPEHDGGTDIINYVVEKREGYKRMWQQVGNTASPEIVAGKLITGNSYNFRISAENSVGVGEPGEMSENVVPKSEFSVPSAPGVPLPSDVTGRSCKLTWDAPANDGESPITGYIVERRAGMHWLPYKEKPRTNSMEITDLREGDRYEFRVIAENKVGPSKPSDSCMPFTAKSKYDKPGAPGKPEVPEPSPTSMLVTWREPIEDGGCAIDGYKLEYRVEGKFKWKPASDDIIPKTSFKLRHVEADEVYEFRVAAVNKAGEGPFSQGSNPVKAAERLAGAIPKLRTPVSTQTVESPRDAVFECEFDLGEPPSTVTWYKDNKEIRAGRKYDVTLRRGVASLVVHGTENLDAGKYKAEASNKMGRVHTEDTLTVLSAPRIEVDARYRGTIQTKGGMSLILTANMSGIPHPTATWYFNDQPIVPSATTTVESAPTYTTLTVGNSSKENEGRYRVVAENKVGTDQTGFVVGIKDKPSAPKNLRITDQHKNYIGIAWDEPTSDGGAPISGYIVEKRDANRNVWTGVAELDAYTHKFKATNLIEGNDYLFRVAAKNPIGVGNFAQTEDSIRAKLPFGTPGAPQHVEMDNLTKKTVTLAWDRPEFDGGSPITGYTVERRQAYSNRWVKVNKIPTRDTMFKITDLLEDEEYEFRIVAENEAGAGKPSETTGTFTARDPYTKPGKPGRPDVKIEGDSAVLSWSAPTDDGRSKITNYIVEAKANGDVRWKVASGGDKVKGTIFTAKGLQPDVGYEFRVTAENKAGPGAPSSPSSPIKYEEQINFLRELQDVKVTKLPNNATFECEISKPHMQVQWYKEEQPIRKGHKYGIMSQGKIHRLDVRDVDGKDEGEYSIIAKNNRSTGRLRVEAPPAFTTEAHKDEIIIKEGESVIHEVPFCGNPQPKVDWDYNRGPIPMNRRFNVDVIYNMTSLTIARAEVKDSGTYNLKLSNSFGQATLSTKLIVIGRPTAPNNLDVSKVTENAVTLRWDRPDSDRGARIKGYVIEKRDPHRHAYTQVGTSMSTEFTVGRLMEGNQYVFRVSAENEVGIGEPAELSQSITTKSPFVVPAAPTAPVISEIFSNRCKLSWQPPTQDGGSAVTGYHIERRSKASPRWVFVNKYPVKETTFHCTDLYDDTEYEFRVSAENKVGSGPPSEPSQPFIARDPWTVPGAPMNPQVKDVERRAVTLKWFAPAKDGGSPVTGYIIEYRVSGQFGWDVANHGEPIMDQRYTVRNLKDGESYEFRIAAVNKAGKGAFAPVDMLVAVKEPVVGDPPRILRNVSDVVVTAPETATLDCAIKPGMRDFDVHWFKENKEVYRGRKYEMLFWDNRASLVIKDSEPSDSAKYRCELSTPLGRVQSVGSLIVYSKPKLEYDGRFRVPQQLKAGMSMVIPVDFTGNPAPSATWSFRGAPLAHSSKYQIDTSEYNTTLTVRDTEIDDSGTYIVNVSNRAGTATASFDVNFKGKPGAPRHFEAVSTSNDSVQLVWDTPSSEGGAPITNYVIEKCGAHHRSMWSGAGTTDRTTFTAGKLHEGNEYYFRVAAENAVGLSNFVELPTAVVPKPPFTPPSEPRNLILDHIDKSGIHLSWDPPRSDGGSRIQGYIMEKRTPFSPRWTRINRQPIRGTDSRVTDLYKGDEYEFRVVAVNEAGMGKPSDMTPPVAIKDPFDVPGEPGTPQIISIDHGMATLRWTAPRSDGGSPITNYKVEMRTAGAYRWELVNIAETIRTTEHTITGLREGADYEFRVSAENKAGVGRPSQASKSAKYVEKVDFVRPLQDHRATRLGEDYTFEVELSRDHGRAQWLRDGMEIRSDKKYNIWNEAARHKLTIREVDDRDAGDYAFLIKGHRSAARLNVEAMPKFTREDLYSEALVLKAGQSAAVEVPFWAAPQPRVRWNFEGLTLHESRRIQLDTVYNMTSLTITKAQKSDAGTYSLHLDNPFGSARLDVKVIVLDKPSAPRNLRSVPESADSVQLSWNPPANNGGCEIIRYLVEKREALRMVWQKAGSTTDHHMSISRLSDSAQYVFRVAAENSVGVGEWVELERSISAKSAHAVPAPPTQPKASEIYRDSCILTWGAPPSDGGAPILCYHVERRPKNGPYWTRASSSRITDTSYHAVDLHDGESYEFRVYAENRVGFSEPSRISAPVLAKDPWSVPGRPGPPKVGKMTRRSCLLTWTPPDYDGGNPIRNYIIEYRTVGSYKWQQANVGERVTEPTYKVTGLEADEEYEFRVSAENKAGAGEFSQTMSPTVAKDRTVGNMPEILLPLSDVTASAGKTLVIECDVTAGNPPAKFKWYKDGKEIYRGSRKYHMDYNPVAHMASLTILHPDQTDSGRYKLEAVNDIGRVDTTGRVTIHAGPKLDFDNRYLGILEVKRGTSLMLPINFSAVPKPRVSWYRDGIPLHTVPGRIKIETGDGYSTLTITGIELEEAGKYRIEVENQAGSASTEFQVLVKSPPSAPASLRLTSISKESVTLAWEPPERDGGSPITGYIIERRDPGYSGWSRVGTVGPREYNYLVDKLSEGKDYYFRVIAVNENGNGDAIETAKAVKIKSAFNVPDAPKGVECVEACPSAIGLEWSPPRRDGGAPVRGYIIERRQGFSSRFIPITRTLVLDTYFRDTNVNDGQEYEYRIVAENEVGQSEASRPIGPIAAVQPFNVPGAPGRPEIMSLTKSTVTLAWQPPRRDGGLHITSYVVESKSTASYDWTICNIGRYVTEPTCQVQNLVEGTTYEFRVIAENKAGRSQPSPVSDPVVIREPVAGNAPRVIRELEDVFVRPGETAQLECRISGEPTPDITWTKDFQRLPNDKYKYQMKYRDAVASLLIHDVVDADSGRYTAEASNSYGYVATSAAVKVKSPPRLEFDSRYLDMRVPIGGNIKINVNVDGEPTPTLVWTRNGMPLKGYRNVMIDTDEFTSSVMVKRASREDSGEYHILAKNQWGMAEATFTVAVQDVPGMPTSLTVTDVDRNAISISWNRPRNDGGSRIRRYVVERCDVQRNYWTTAGTVDASQTGFTVTGLMEGHDYTFRVSAENDLGVGEPCQTDVPTRAKGAIDTPEPVPFIRHTEARRGSIMLEWDQPRTPITSLRGYVLERREEAAPSWSRVAALPPTTTRYKVPDLMEGRQYKFRILTETREGLSSPLEYEPPVVLSRPAEAPYRPVGPIIITKKSSNSMMIEWRPPLDDGGKPVQGYVVEMSEGGGSWKRVGYTPSRETSFTISGLTEGSTYFFRVSAENDVGFSLPLQSDLVVPTEPISTPAKPKALKYKEIGRDSVMLQWEPPVHDGGAPITNYVIEKRDMRSDRWTYVHKVASAIQQYTVPGLLTGKDYMFRIRPVNRMGVGEPMEQAQPLRVISPYKPPAAPRGPVRVTNVTNRSAEISWQPPLETGGCPIDSYIIEIKPSSQMTWRRVGMVDAMVTSYLLDNLMDDTDYSVRVIARNREGESHPLVSDTISVFKPSMPPTAPSLVKVVRVTRDSATLQWNPPVSDGGAPVTNYLIYKRVMPVDSWEEVGKVNGHTTNFTVINLREGKHHYFAVKAATKNGKSVAADTTSPVVPKKVISRPISPKGLKIVSYSHDTVSLSWTMPESDTPILSFRIEKKEVNKKFWDTVDVVDSSYTNYIVRNLTPGTDYYFRVIAENDTGRSKPYALPEPFIPRSRYAPPAAPKGMTVTEVTRNSATLSWLPPDIDGGAAISAYIIEKRELSSQNWTRVTRMKPFNLSYTVTGLLEGVDYAFRVLAENVEGVSEALTLDQHVRPIRSESKPQPPSGRIRVRRVTSDSVVIEWNSPLDDGGRRILKYIIDYRDVDSLYWQRATTTDPYTKSCHITGLREGREYLFRVIAVNDIGESDGLESDLAVRPIRVQEAPSVPGGPIIITDSTKNSMTLAWQPPVSDGGAAITGYTIEKRDVGGVAGWTRVERVRAHIFNHTVTGLVPGHSYIFRIIAENNIGKSVPLEMRLPVEAKSPFGVPEAVSRIRIIGITETSVTIEWSEPATSGGTPTTGYVIQRREGSTKKWKTVANVGVRPTSYKMTNLSRSKTYYIRIAAENEEGVGEWRELPEPIQPTRPKSLPSEPATLDIDYISDDSVTLHWTRPRDTGGVPLSGYVIEMQEFGSTKWKVGSYVDAHHASHTLNNLKKGTEYSFRVRAENTTGTGPPRTLIERVMPKPQARRPAAPVNLEVIDITEESVTISWLSPHTSGSSRIFRYVVEVCDMSSKGQGWVKVKEVDSSARLVACVENLKEGKPYLFRVYAENQYGPGAATETMDAIVPRSQLGPPSACVGPIRVIRVTRNMLAIYWRPPTDNGGSPIERYIVEKREADRSHWTPAGRCPPDVTAHCITDLVENQMYYFRVIAENAYGQSDALECEKPVIPKRVFESAPAMELESWIQEAHHGLTAAEVSKIIQRVSEVTERTYLAYADEPLTMTHDTLDTSALLPHF